MDIKENTGRQVIYCSNFVIWIIIITIKKLVRKFIVDCYTLWFHCQCLTSEHSNIILVTQGQALCSTATKICLFAHTSCINHRSKIQNWMPSGAGRVRLKIRRAHVTARIRRSCDSRIWILRFRCSKMLFSFLFFLHFCIFIYVYTDIITNAHCNASSDYTWQNQGLIYRCITPVFLQ
jgi:hypothetical protein